MITLTISAAIISYLAVGFWLACETESDRNLPCEVE